jgi:transposase
MSVTTCPGCAERDAVIAALLQRVATLELQVKELQNRLGQNSSNSSLPPSANPLAAPPPVVKKASKRKPGGQPGHPGHQRLRLPPDRITHVVALVPSHCDHCQSPLPALPQPGDPEPTWHQFAEVPRFAANVTEFQGHFRTCPCCARVNHETIPADIRAHAFGPRLAALLAYLSGCQHVSKRGLEEVAETVLGVPIALGSVSALEEQMSEALQGPTQEIRDAVRDAPVKNVDETGWKQASNKCWLWLAVTSTLAYFLIHPKRGAVSLRALLGEDVPGLIGSDRWSAYHVVPLERRQICWAHLRRDFQGMIDRADAGSVIGEELLTHTDILFELWYKVRDGTQSRDWLSRQVEDWLRAEVQSLLARGAGCGCAKTAGMCEEMAKVEPAFWTFVRAEGVEPTNNAAERALRPAVLWRKCSFGCHSEKGCRFVERLLSVTQTLRLQKRPILDYLVEALSAHRSNQAIPQLLAIG